MKKFLNIAFIYFFSINHIIFFDKSKLEKKKIWKYII